MGFDSFFEETVEEFNYDEKRKELIDNLDTLKHMSVEEATLYKKWQEFNKNKTFTNMHISLMSFVKRFGHQLILIIMI